MLSLSDLIVGSFGIENIDDPREDFLVLAQKQLKRGAQLGRPLVIFRYRPIVSELLGPPQVTDLAAARIEACMKDQLSGISEACKETLSQAAASGANAFSWKATRR